MRLKKILIGAFMLIVIAPFAFPQLSSPAESDRNYLIPISLNKSKIYEIKYNKFSLYNRFSVNWENSTTSVPPSFLMSGPDTQFTKFKMKKSPLVAVLLSAIVPGAGQFYNQSYWKIPIIAGLVGYFGYEYINNNNKFKDYRSQYDASITPNNPFGDENLKTLREFYRNQRDDFVWYFIIIYVVNLVDAYVDAHLFDFDVKENKLTRFSNSEYRLKVNFNF